MKTNWILLSLMGVCLLGSFNSKEDACGDLLTKYAQKPKQLEFLSCKKGFGQVVLKARYRVKGKNAATVAKFLQQHYKMGKLKFVCCGWETGSVTFAKTILQEDGSNRFYSVIMYSSETLINKQVRWSDIPYFYVEAQIIDV